VDRRRLKELVGRRVEAEIGAEVVRDASRAREEAPRPDLLGRALLHERDHFHVVASWPEEAIDSPREHRDAESHEGQLPDPLPGDKRIVPASREPYSPAGCMPERQPSLEQRARLGPIVTVSIDEPSLVLGHRALGRKLKKPARVAIQARVSRTPPELLTRQLRGTRHVQAFLAERARDRRVPLLVRRGLLELMACVEAWGEGVGLGASVTRLAPVDGARVLPRDLAWWAQDDNAGCQTGMVRRPGGSVALWHTEEDTIGFLDRPRLAVFAMGKDEWCAFLYPYLLPGPAFGWRPEQLHAVDSLHTRRREPTRGTLSGVASWLVWRLGPEVPAREVLRSLTPFVDGSAVHVVSRGRAGIVAESHEAAGSVVRSRRLGVRPGSVSVQVNAVCELEGRLGEEEALSRASRALYERRLDRMKSGIERVGTLPEGYSAQAILRMIASRRGGSYAYANGDVKAHVVAIVGKKALDVHVGSGPAHPEDMVRAFPPSATHEYPRASHGDTHG